ncbi:MAG: response regulator, partial [Woeseia sp.]
MSLKRALVVDDSKVARVTLQKQLQEYDLQVELAESGEAAIELLKTRMVDVIFMDHIMPGMDGLEAVALIKSNPLTATIPVMMYTSKEGEVYVSEARALGAVGVLP